MATTTSTLESQNFLQPNGFKLVINRERFKNLEFFAQTVSHPDISVAPTIAPFRRTNLQLPGDKVEYGPLVVDAILDENMNVYKEMVKWIKSTTDEKNKTSTSVTSQNRDTTVYDITLSILSSHNNQIDTIVYKGAFPINVGSVNFQSTVDNITYITFPITFSYTTFTISD